MAAIAGIDQIFARPPDAAGTEAGQAANDARRRPVVRRGRRGCSRLGRCRRNLRGCVTSPLSLKGEGELERPK